jgi:hypothetical protein
MAASGKLTGKGRAAFAAAQSLVLWLSGGKAYVEQERNSSGNRMAK